MSRDPAAEGTRWLAQARDDVEAARLLTDHDRHAQACFLAQQAGEKGLKAFLYARGAETVLGHSVGALCREVRELAPDIADRCDDWATLDQHRIPTRYPDALPGGIPGESYTGSQADAAIALATDILDAVEGRQQR